MDAVEYLKTVSGMCKSHKPLCYGDDNHTPCELRIKANEKGMSCNDYASAYPEEAVEIVERWTKDHPRKTRQSEFLKMFPRVNKALNDVVAFCPENMDSEFECPIKKGSDRDQCTSCRKKYWLEEVD